MQVDYWAVVIAGSRRAGCTWQPDLTASRTPRGWTASRPECIVR